jgi:hypothetical protein
MVFLQFWIHRCIWGENPVEGVATVFAEIPRLSEKIARGGGGNPPISGLIAFLLTHVLKFA